MQRTPWGAHFSITHLAAQRLHSLGPWGAHFLLKPMSPPGTSIPWALVAPIFSMPVLRRRAASCLGALRHPFFCNSSRRLAALCIGPLRRPFLCNPSRCLAAACIGPLGRPIFCVTHLAAQRLHSLGPWGAQFFAINPNAWQLTHWVRGAQILCDPSRHPAASFIGPLGRPFFETQLAARRLQRPILKPFPRRLAASCVGPLRRPFFVKPISLPGGCMHWALGAPKLLSNPSRRPAASSIGPVGRPICL